MTTPFDKAIEDIAQAGYHNHRLETHSDTVSNGLIEDLKQFCVPLREEFSWGISRNTINDPARTVELFRKLPTRQPGYTHVEGYDYVLLVPVLIDNVNRPSLPRPNLLGIDVDIEYQQMLERMCAAYTARWHM